MAPSLVAYTSAKVINVNPAEHSPITSSPFGEQAALVQYSGTERVEDSLEQPPQGGPVQEPHTMHEDSDDDLYDVSPKGKAALDATRSSARRAMASMGDKADQEGEVQAGNAPVTTGAGMAKATNTPQNALADLLANGATARVTQVNGHRTQNKPDGATKQGLHSIPRVVWPVLMLYRP